MALFNEKKLRCINTYPWAMKLLEASSSHTVNEMSFKGSVEREALKSEIMGYIVTQSEGYISDEEQEEIATLCLTEFNADKFMVGYLFKPTHTTVNYLKKGATGDLRRRYRHNFTANENEAEVVFNRDEARQAILKLVGKFPNDPEYQWTPVIINIKENTRTIVSL